MKEAIRYLAFGDSLTVGYGASPGFGFVPQYAKALADELGCEVLPKNAGVNGLTTQYLLDSLRTDPELRAGIREADLITITAGGNDLIQAALPYVYEGDANILLAALQGYQTNYREMLQLIRDMKGDAWDRSAVVLVGLFNPLPLMAEAAVWVRKFNEFLRELACGNVFVVDIYDAFVGKERELLYSDHIHPNAKGYAVMADHIVRSVPAQLYAPLRK
ncbi:GDSL-type esterase/lipase family protein [Paenibacillus chartarius]|uniref:GDSL-type esterase/lipase family protein n=1 Tax=Paenibacillus chartarius TaxID=747481 RepID=A0ABV6DP56_9BACL